ncbi:hypothetical protein EGX35_01170 [Clavibacter nebraskensis]|uniref:Uncharacterized protein n=1 Tax=Clavibacter nebraskensis TaxID=31963 RepID=A0A399Q7R5_9MICO|nr:hypothetical protein EGX36_01170 [Clavibacter nebraskensis]QGV70775.1 hypothetical protein EGX37_01170 [Clavibacter nebraskensis]QGV73567.1 hypothetical protein EGX35_01170 [Clavibacter nebraskensis]RIJ15033.1 hypothetical protein DZF97_05405 [Clavibacter nebraskensis]UKF29455.1 hypothetical protein FGQ65_08600 [Clavibacter nebraskensis]
MDKRGKANVDRDVAKYVQASRSAPWVVFRDTDAACPVTISQKLLPHGDIAASRFQLRLAHSMTEAWLLADRRGFATHFQVSRERIPVDPEGVAHAKREVLRLCADSRSRNVREAMVTDEGEVGPLYVSTIDAFAREHWDVGAAAESSPSLRRAIERIRCME